MIERLIITYPIPSSQALFTRAVRKHMYRENIQAARRTRMARKKRRGWA